MQRRAHIRLAALTFALALGALTAVSVAARAGEQSGVVETSVEEIYVLRSVREARSKPTEFCAPERTKMTDPAWEDQYTFRSLETRSKDGRILNTDAGTVGEIHACFGNSSDPSVWELYGDLTVNGVSGKAFGKCYKTKADQPETGINLFACAFDLFDLSGGYIGGQLTTNSLTSPELFGTSSKPAGYTQVSIATIRLWRQRAGQ